MGLLTVQKGVWGSRIWLIEINEGVAYCQVNCLPGDRPGKLPGRLLPGRLLPGRLLPGRLLPGRLLPGRLLPGS